MIDLNTTQAGLAGHAARTSVDTLAILKSAFIDHGVKRILDIGCGDGALAELIQPMVCWTLAEPQEPRR